jgi:hypothetical protein
MPNLKQTEEEEIIINSPKKEEEEIIINSPKKEEEEIIINSPKIITHTRLNVKCSRSFYCNASNCESLQMRSPTISHSYHQMQSFLLSGNINRNKISSNQVQIQYWGDSIQTTLECDMRQWLYEISLFQRNQSDIDVLPATKFKSSTGVILFRQLWNVICANGCMK